MVFSNMWEELETEDRRMCNLAKLDSFIIWWQYVSPRMRPTSRKKQKQAEISKRKGGRRES